MEVLTGQPNKLISDLATDPLKRQQYNWLARELQDLLKRAKVENEVPARQILAHTQIGKLSQWAARSGVQ